ncbi:hypothetical protein RS130_09830 [Paraglaciecola aquimarina]|uniref:Xylose isomerase-like TIM barrel domain-containing protein n=1 Tax=Paraglaciecola aquimarina TaxID=1235557 RepID=A0ABU3SWA2_9ALTE|nr:hypothetical protein [Paraglaciecola aquimarina]MDU0354192.1 hypothetical protein [Paraglaciecola aquimarina]
MMLQLDIGWVNYAGKDPIEYVRRYAGRTLATHIKIRTNASGQSPIIGEDDYPWAELIKVLSKDGGTQWLVIEQEEYSKGRTSLSTVAASKKGLDKIIQTL